MQERRPRTTARAIRSRTIRQDLSFIVSVLLVLAVVAAALTAVSSEEAEFFGLGDDLHGLAGWAMILLTGLHTLLCGGQMVRYAKRRLRRLLGVGGVIQTEADRGPEESPGRSRPGGVAGGRDGL